MTILDDIVAVKHEEVARMTWFESVPSRECDHRFREAIRGRGHVSLIAEVKKASPSEGVIREDFNPAALARAYEANGASAISVVTDESFFQGNLEMLREVVAAVQLPVLRKDFVVDGRQIMEAFESGASAVLLIAAILSESQLREFRALAESLNMDALVETHDAQELEKALASGATLIGCNNRDLRTFKVDLNTTLSLPIPREVVFVTESGIRDRVDMRRMLGVVDAALVGTSILKCADVGEKVRELLQVRPLVKVCGVQDQATLSECERLGVEFVGYNFYPRSSRYVDPSIARGFKTSCRTVGLFVNESIEKVNQLAEDLNLDYVQLHGQESPEYCVQVNRPVIKSFLAGENVFPGVIPLFDLKKGESGVISLAAEPDYPFFLAGGLTSENVCEVKSDFQPFVLDVARGVETNGKKDIQKIQQFINQLESC